MAPREPTGHDDGDDHEAQHEQHEHEDDDGAGEAAVTDVQEPEARPGEFTSAEAAAASAPKPRGRVRRAGRRAGMQLSRIVLLATIVALSGMALGYFLAYPLRFVDYQKSTTVQIDQASLAGNVEVAKSLVSAEDLGQGWAAGDPALGGFGVLGADVCGSPVDTPTPLSSKEAAVFTNPANKSTVIAQALRVDQWKSAGEYVGQVADALEACDTFYRVQGDKRVKVTSKPSQNDPPVPDYVARTYTSADGVQEWSMMAVGDVIIAIQYLGETPPPAKLLPELERSVLRRIDPADFVPGGGTTTTTVAPAAGSQGGGAANETPSTTVP